MPEKGGASVAVKIHMRSKNPGQNMEIVNAVFEKEVMIGGSPLSVCATMQRKFDDANFPSSHQQGAWNRASSSIQQQTA